MSTNFVAINIGNTRTQIGVFVAGKLEARSVVRNDQDDELGQLVDRIFTELPDPDESPVLFASVNPAVERRVMAMVQQRQKQTVLRIGQDIPIAIGQQLDPEAIVGVDRFLNAAAAYDVLKQACVVVDAGTAITVDYVDGEGTFHGGAIGPGAQMMLDSLHHGAAQLPQLQMARPDETIGHSTSQAMLTAVFHGVRGMVRELVEQYAQIAGTYPVVVATGGDASLLFEDYDLVERITEDLTLMGIAVTFKAQNRIDA